MGKKLASIGAVVARLRHEKGVSQRRLQDLSEGQINASWLANLETGIVKNPKPAKIELIARLLGTTITSIYEQAGIIHIPPVGSSPDEQQLIAIYRSLPARFRLSAIKILENLASADSVQEQPTSDEEEQELEQVEKAA
jgi:transcriptional regulator with XRE-family HTH domain